MFEKRAVAEWNNDQHLTDNLGLKFSWYRGSFRVKKGKEVIWETESLDNCEGFIAGYVTAAEAKQ